MYIFIKSYIYKAYMYIYIYIYIYICKDASMVFPAIDTYNTGEKGQEIPKIYNGKIYYTGKS